MMVAIIGFTSLHLSRLELRMSTSQQDDSYARLLAQSSVEMAVAHIEQHSDWRTRYTSGTEIDVTPGNNFKTLYFKYIDTVDGDLGNNSTDPVTIQGIGRCGNSTYLYSVDYKASVTSSQQVSSVIKSFETTTNNNDDVNESNYMGQHFIPTLPAEVTSYAIPQIEVYLEGHGSASATLTFNFYSSNASGQPDTLLESLSVPETSLPATGSPSYHTFNLNSATDLTPGQGYCFTLEQTGGGNAATVHYRPGVSQTDTHMVWGGWGGWFASANESLKYRVHGFYTTETAGGEFTITPGSWQRVAAP